VGRCGGSEQWSLCSCQRRASKEKGGPCVPLYHPAIPSVLNVFHRQSKGFEYNAPRTRPVTGSVIVFSECPLSTFIHTAQASDRRHSRLFFRRKMRLTVVHSREDRICRLHGCAHTNTANGGCNEIRRHRIILPSVFDQYRFP